MDKNAAELERQIREKNLILGAICHKPRCNDGEAMKVKTELDNLLYLYYKSVITGRIDRGLTCRTGGIDRG